MPDELVRRVRVVRGRVAFRLECRPAFDYARAAHRGASEPARRPLRRAGAEPRPGRFGAITVATAPAWSPISRSGRGRRPRSSFAASAEDDRPGCCPDAGEAEDLFRDTVAYWRRWLSKSTYTGRWREMVHRSALTLKLLSFEPTGAIVAAPTCSLPEAIGGPRNWDYRYTWIRDAAFTLYGLLRIGFTEEAARFRDWLKDRWQEAGGNGSGPLQLMYGIDGRAETHGGVARPLGGLLRLPARAHRQRRLPPVAARHLWRADGRRIPPQQVRGAHRL